EYQQRLTALGQQQEALALELARVSQAFALEKSAGEADVVRLAKILPQGSVYIDLAHVRFNEFDGNSRIPHYLAFVLVPSSIPEVKLLDLGPAEAVDQQITAYREAMEELGQYLDTLGEVASPKLDKITRAQEAAAQALSDLLLLPLRQVLEGKKQILLSPDGN